MVSPTGSPGVTVREVDLSQVVTRAPSATAAIVGFSRKGPVGSRNLVTTAKQFISQAGNPNSADGYLHHSSIVALRGIRQLHWVRVVNGATYAGRVVNMGSSATIATQTSALGVVAPEELDEFSFSSFSNGQLLIAAENPGVWGNKLSVALEIEDEDEGLYAISVFDRTDNSDGTLVERWVVSSDPAKKDGFNRSQYVENVINDNSAYIRVVANSSLPTDGLPVTEVSGETVATGDNSATSFSGSLARVPVKPRSVAFVSDDTVISNESIGTGDGATTAFTARTSKFPIKADSVTVTDGSRSASDNAEGKFTGSVIGRGSINYLTGVIDITWTSAPTSGASIQVTYTHTVTLKDDGVGNLDGSGVSGDLDYSSGEFNLTFDIAPSNSQDINADYDTALVSVLADGADGDTPTDAQKIAAWDRFTDRDQSSIRLLIGGGEESIAVQRKMYQICESRLDCFALLDTPEDYQTAGKAVDWRQDHQNFNTTFAALYPGRYRDQVEGSGVVEDVPRSGYEAAVIGLMNPEWLPPAGLRRGVIPVIGVSQSYTEAERGFLYNNDLNPYRVVPGQGIVTWG